jgi:hypothetical protein
MAKYLVESGTIRCALIDLNVRTMSTTGTCPLMANVAFFGGSSAGVTDDGNSWSNNISFGGAPPWGWGPQGNVILGHDTMSCTSNKCNVNPLLSNPSGNNFALASGSPAIGYGQSQPFLYPHVVDAGACHRSLLQCP